MKGARTNAPPSSLNPFQSRSRTGLSTGVPSAIKIAEALKGHLDVSDSIGDNQQSLSIDDHKKRKAKVIAEVFAQMPVKDGMLYRFYDGTDRGLTSLAEQNSQEPLTPKKANHFKQGHTQANEKVIQQRGQLFYSPYVSTTKSLPHFLDNTLAPRGDYNIREDVFNKAPTIAQLADIPTEELIDANPSNADRPLHNTGDNYFLPFVEREVIYNTSRKPLSTYLKTRFDNPLLLVRWSLTCSGLQ